MTIMKKNKLNYFQMMDQKKQNETKSPQKEKTPPATSYNEAKKVAILDVVLTPAEENEHYQASYQYALKKSDSNGAGRIRIYMDMNKKLHFDPIQDEAFIKLWQSHQLLCLIDLPTNWKTMTLEDVDDEDAEDFDFNDPAERFDYLYEVGMSYYQK